MNLPVVDVERLRELPRSNLHGEVSIGEGTNYGETMVDFDQEGEQPDRDTKVGCVNIGSFNRG